MTQPRPTDTPPRVRFHPGRQFHPGDRVQMRLATATGRKTMRHGIVQHYVGDGLYSVEMVDGKRENISYKALKPLPPSTEEPRGPGAGRPTTTATLRVGDVLAVRDVTPHGSTPLRRYTVASVEDTADGLRVELAGEGGSGMVVVR